ncbi:hypothetical protein GCM10023224_32420 [Streptomonospora halophila]|uniref:Uncharacterized protein n=1 Tax=Streptomonospora halophila TaxID=427369 RepID=A0ABP9GLN5_9ACTN
MTPKKTHITVRRGSGPAESCSGAGPGGCCPRVDVIGGFSLPWSDVVRTKRPAVRGGRPLRVDRCVF